MALGDPILHFSRCTDKLDHVVPDRWNNSKPPLRVRRLHQLPIMPMYHGGRVPEFPSHPARVVGQREAIGRIGMPQRIILPLHPCKLGGRQLQLVVTFMGALPD